MLDFFNLPTSESTTKIGHKLAKQFQAGDVIDLEGPIGSGKTTFASAIATSLGADPKEVHSPSYTIIHSYHLSSNEKIKHIHHIDAWRIQRDQDIEGTGLEEIFTESKSLFLIEWGENIKSYLPKKRWKIQFETTEAGGRRIYLSSPKSESTSGDAP